MSDTIPEEGGPRIYRGREHEAIPVPLDELLTEHRAMVFPEAEKRGLFAVRLEKNKLVFTATNYVGLIPINDRISIEVRPKVPVSNLVRLLSISGFAPDLLERFTRDYSLSDEPIPLLLDLFTHALLSSMVEVRQFGLYREYVRREEDTSFPRGKILFGATMQRYAARNVTHRVTASSFHRVVDNGPNRLIKYGVWHLSQHYQRFANSLAGAKRTLNRLNEIYAELDEVHLDHSWSFLNHPLVLTPASLPSIRDYYRPPVILAKAVLTDRGVSLDSPGEDIVALPTMLVRLDDVFEAYVRNVIRRGLAEYPNSVVADGNREGTGGARKLLFDTAPSEDAAPDVVIHDSNAPSSRPQVVLDVKYKRSPGREDLNQLVTYSASYRCPINVLVHPIGDRESPGIRPLGRIDSASFYHYGMNLGSADLPQEERNLVAEVRRLLGLP